MLSMSFNGRVIGERDIGQTIAKVLRLFGQSMPEDIMNGMKNREEKNKKFFKLIEEIEKELKEDNDEKNKKAIEVLSIYKKRKQIGLKETGRLKHFFYNESHDIDNKYFIFRLKEIEAEELSELSNKDLFLFAQCSSNAFDKALGVLVIALCFFIWLVTAILNVLAPYDVFYAFSIIGTAISFVFDVFNILSNIKKIKTEKYKQKNNIKVKRTDKDKEDTSKSKDPAKEDGMPPPSQPNADPPVKPPPFLKNEKIIIPTFRATLTVAKTTINWSRLALGIALYITPSNVNIASALQALNITNMALIATFSIGLSIFYLGKDTYNVLSGRKELDEEYYIRLSSNAFSLAASAVSIATFLLNPSSLPVILVLCALFIVFIHLRNAFFNEAETIEDLKKEGVKDFSTGRRTFLFFWRKPKETPVNKYCQEDENSDDDSDCSSISGASNDNENHLQADLVKSKLKMISS